MSHIWVLLFCVVTPTLAQYGDEQPPIEENPCNLVDCIPNTRCIVVNGEAKCVPLNETSQQQCKANEQFTDCGSACEPSCKNPKPEVCTLQCVVGCQCKPGFFRNDQNACVAKCPGGGAGTCGLNEERKQCGTACEPTCANPNPGCTKQCIIDVCQCKQGYIRDANKKCIPVEQCPKDRIIPCSEMNCPKGTVCELGRVICPFVPPCFTRQTKCVPLTPEETCATKKCPPGTVCEQETIFCIRAPCPQPKPQCVKKEPFNPCAATTCPVGSECRVKQVQCIRAPCPPIGECYTPPQSNQCGKFETFKTCASHCEPSCTNKSPICILSCAPPRCQCNQGFYRNSSGACVTEAECDALPTCGMNEAYTDCTSACQPKCGVNSTTCTKECGPPGCECLPGYFRNAENICVSHDQCTTNSNTSCGKNEEYTPCSGCESQCFGTTSRCSRECGPPKCQCRDNYFRHMNGSCVAKEHCSATTGSSKPLILPRPGLNGTIPTVPMNCAANEYYTNCTSSCEPRCNGTKDICDKACGPPGCQCLPGYVRADDNSCVLRKQCGGATTCGMNEEHVICSGCEDKCSGERSRCGRGCGPPKCQCAANFYRHVNGSCVAKEHCIASEAATSCANVLCAPKTECQMVYSSECLHAGHCLAVPQCIPQNLTNTCANVRCDSSRECKMVQHNCSSTPCNPMPHCLPPASGTTTPRFGINSSSTRTTPVPTDSQECEENEEFTECMPSCQMTCTGRRECSSTFAATMCTAGCVCKAGYRRNADGQCVKPRRCYLSPGCKAYEEWSSCANCENKCDGSTRSCSTCYSGCACIRGYSRSAMDRCIPTEDCP